MNAILKIAHELGIWHISCNAERPKIKEKTCECDCNCTRWDKLEINSPDLTGEQRKYIQELHDLYLPGPTGRNGYGGGFKKDLVLELEKELWTLQGCYFLNLEEDRIVISMDRAIVRY